MLDPTEPTEPRDLDVPGESTVSRILAAVDLLQPDDCGAFVIELGDRHVGSVLVENNRVCWAAAAGLRRRLRDLLRESLTTMLSADELEAMYQRCAAEGRRLGEELVARSVLQGDVMRSAIRQHTIESLIALPDRIGERVTWSPHRADGYLPRFTFTPVELYVGVNAKMYALEAADAELALSVVELGTPSATFVRDDRGQPIAIMVGGSHHGLAEVIELGAWADAAFGATPGFSPEVLRRVAAAVTGDATIAWRSSRHVVHAAIISGHDALDRVVASLLRRGYPTVLSRRAPRPSFVTFRGGLGEVDGNP